jgi:hypothetical protein
MFPHEEYLMKAMECTNFKLIGLLNDIGRLYTVAMAKKSDVKNFKKSLEIGKAISRCAKEIATIQGDDPIELH